MNIVACPSCSKQLQYNPQQAGQQVRCPGCQVALILPSANTVGTNVGPLGNSPIDPLAPIGQPPAQQPHSQQPTSAYSQTQSTASFTESNQLPHNRYLQQPQHGHQGQTAQNPVAGKVPKLPKGFKVEQSPSHLSLTTPGSLSQFGTIGVLALFMILFASIVLPIILGAMFGSSIVVKLLIYLVSPAAFFGVIYLIVATFMNRRVVEVTKDTIAVKMKGPVPFPSFANTMATQSVQQIYVVRRTHFKGFYYGMDSISEMASTAVAVHDGIQNGWFYYSYHVFVLLNNGWRKELIGGDIGPKGARFLEKSVEQFLGIADQPVVSTWYQSLFYRESTLDEKSKNFSGGGLQAKCLFLPLPYFIFATFVMCVFALVVGAILLAAIAVNLPKDRVAQNGAADKKKAVTLDELKSNSSLLLVDDFEDGSIAPRWQGQADNGLKISESGGVVKIHGMVPRHPERYVNASLHLSEKFATKSFTAEIDVLAASGTFDGPKHQQRHYGFYATSGNRNIVGIQYWGGRYRISYNNGSGSKRKYAPSNGDEMTKWHKWRIVYDASSKKASVFVDKRQISDSVTVDLGEFVTFNIRLSCSPRTNIEGVFDNFRVSFQED